MATNFPGGIDTFAPASPTSGLDNPSHSGLHNDLGDGLTAVQTQLVNEPYGLVHLNTTTMSAVASQSINDVFSADYDHYKIFGYVTRSAGAGYIDLRLRVSGSDNSSNNYKWAQFFQRFKTSNALTPDYTNALVSAWRFFGASASDSYFESIIYNPFASKISAFDSKSIDSASTDDGYRYDISGTTSVTTSYTGFSLLISSGTISGEISIFGIRR